MFIKFIWHAITFLISSDVSFNFEKKRKNKKVYLLQEKKEEKKEKKIGMRPPCGNRTRAIVNALLDKLGKFGKMFISKQDNANGLQLKLVRMVVFKRLKSLVTSFKSRVLLGLFHCVSFC